MNHDETGATAKPEAETPTPRTPDIHSDFFGYMAVQFPATIGHLPLIEWVNAQDEKLAEATAKLDYVHKMGLRFGMMKTSDKPEPYLQHIWEEDSDHQRMFREWSHSIGWEDRLSEANSKTHAMFTTAVKTEQELKSVIADLKAANASANATIETLEKERNLLIQRADDQDDYISNVDRRVAKAEAERDSLRQQLANTQRERDALRDNHTSERTNLVHRDLLNQILAERDAAIRERDEARNAGVTILTQKLFKSPHWIKAIEDRDAARAEVERLKERVEIAERGYAEAVRLLSTANKEVERLEKGNIAANVEAARLRSSLADANKEVERLKAQVHDMCHDLHIKDPSVSVSVFCDGCEAYQIEKFGESPITKLRSDLSRANADVAAMREALTDISKAEGNIDKVVCLATITHCRERAKLALSSTPSPPVIPATVLKEASELLRGRRWCNCHVGRTDYSQGGLIPPHAKDCNSNVILKVRDALSALLAKYSE